MVPALTTRACCRIAASAIAIHSYHPSITSMIEMQAQTPGGDFQAVLVDPLAS